jgi:hypothetical protein
MHNFTFAMGEDFFGGRFAKKSTIMILKLVAELGTALMLFLNDNENKTYLWNIC